MGRQLLMSSITVFVNEDGFGRFPGIRDPSSGEAEIENWSQDATTWIGGEEMVVSDPVRPRSRILEFLQSGQNLRRRKGATIEFRNTSEGQKVRVKDPRPEDAAEVRCNVFSRNVTVRGSAISNEPNGTSSISPVEHLDFSVVIWVDRRWRMSGGGIIAGFRNSHGGANLGYNAGKQSLKIVPSRIIKRAGRKKGKGNLKLF